MGFLPIDDTMKKYVIILIILSIIPIMEWGSHLYLQAELPELDSRKWDSDGWVLTGETHDIYGISKSVQGFEDKGWHQVIIGTADALKISEFAPVFDKYCAAYGKTDLAGMLFWQKEACGSTLRAAVNRDTRETHIYIFKL